MSFDKLKPLNRAGEKYEFEAGCSICGVGYPFSRMGRGKEPRQPGRELSANTGNSSEQVALCAQCGNLPRGPKREP